MAPTLTPDITSRTLRFAHHKKETIFHLTNPLIQELDIYLAFDVRLNHKSLPQGLAIVDLNTNVQSTLVRRSSVRIHLRLSLTAAAPSSGTVKFITTN